MFNAHDPPRQLARYVIMMMNVQSVLFYRTEVRSMTEASVVDYTYSLPVATTIFFVVVCSKCCMSLWTLSLPSGAVFD